MATRKEREGTRLGRVLAATAVLLLVARPAAAQLVDPQDVSIFATASGGGSLTTDHDFAVPVALFPSACLGGFCLYSATDPGFITRADDIPAAGLFALATGTDVALEVIALDDEVSVLVGSRLLDGPGESAPLGTAPGLHLHPTWQLTIPAGGETGGPFSITFRLVPGGGPYAASAALTLQLAATAPGPSATPAATPTTSPAPSPSAPPPTPVATATSAPTPAATPTPGPTPTASATAGPTPAPSTTPRPSATPAASQSPGGGSPGPSRTPEPTPTPGASPSAAPPASPTPAGTTPTPGGASPTPRPTPSPGVATPRPTPTGTPRATPHPTASPGPTPRVPASAVLQQPAARGDQVVLYHDARPGFATFLGIANGGAAELDVRIDFHGSDVRRTLSLTERLAAGARRTIDVSVLVADGLAPEPGIAVATAVDALGVPVVSRALGGSFSVANLESGAAWGAPGAARSAVASATGRRPALGTRIDGDAIVLERIAPAGLDLATFHDPATLDPAAVGGDQLVFVSFDDASGAGPLVRSAAMRWVVSAWRADGSEIARRAHDTAGVEASSLRALLGAEGLGSSGRLELAARIPAAGNRMVLFAQSLGTFASGHALPPLALEEEIR